MKISELRLEDFRNYASEHVVFDDGINIVNGRNAGCVTRSHIGGRIRYVPHAQDGCCHRFVG